MDGSEMGRRSGKFADRKKKPLPPVSRESARKAARQRASDLASETLERMLGQDVTWAEMKSILGEIVDELEDA
jgi:hypothetical protein